VTAVVAVVAAVTAGCGEEAAGPASTTTPSTSPPVTEPLEPAQWFAAELVDLPDGLGPQLAEDTPDEARLGGRTIGYSDGVGDRYDWSVAVAASDPAVMPLQEIVDRAGSLADERLVETEVRGHRALVVPLTDDGRSYGWIVMWDERPDLRISVADGRRASNGQQMATVDTVLDLTDHVRGLTRAAWDDRLLGLGIATHVGEVDPASEVVEVGRGEVDGDGWVLSAYVPPRYPLGDFDQRLICVELAYRGESSGVQCDFVPAWSVLGGHDLVFGRAPADAEEVVLRPAGDRDLFDPVTTETTDELERVDLRFFVAEMPYGACETHAATAPDAEPFGFTAPPPGSEAIAACR
jgi:hypothetical protein